MVCDERGVVDATMMSAVEAVVHGDIDTLQSLLQQDSSLVFAEFGGATLLHYIAANGVPEPYQKTPSNAVEIARTLLEAGAVPDALADMYGKPSTTLQMLVSSTPPARAGLQVPLVELLLDFGADLEGPGKHSNLFLALAFGMPEAAELLVKRGAGVDLPIAAGLGWFERAEQLLPAADAESRHRAMSLAAQHGHVELVRLLLGAGEDPNRYNLEGNHAHSTPLHQAVIGGHEEVVRWLVEHGARLDLRDRIWDGTPLGWAMYGGGKNAGEMVACLRSLGAEF